MRATNRRIILVTGLPRSGTTVIGDVLATAHRTTSIYEPMNFQSGDIRFDASFPVCGSDDFSPSDFCRFLDDIKNSRLKLRLGLFPHDRGLKALVKLFIGGRTKFSYLKTRLSPLARHIIWKDPFALFCVPAAAKENISTVVAYRPPEAIAASYKRLRWSYDVQHLVTRMGESYDGAFVEDDILNTYRQGVSNPVLGAVFLWRLSVAMLLNAIDEGFDVTLVPTGQLPDTAADVFPHLFQGLDLEASSKTEHLLNTRFKKRPQQSAVPQGHPHSRNRDLSSVNTYWEEVLTEREAEFVSQHCRELKLAIERQCLDVPSSGSSSPGSFNETSVRSSEVSV